MAVDFAILDWVQAHLRCAVLDLVMPWITMLGEVGAVWILLALVLLIRKDTRPLGVAVAAALAVGAMLASSVFRTVFPRLYHRPAGS